MGNQIDAYTKRKSGQNKIVVYTAIFGTYDTLMLPNNLDIDIDYICFTDRNINSYGVWQIKPSPYYHPDKTRIARYVKTHPYELLPNYDIAVWIDGNIIIRGNVKKYISLVFDQKRSLGFIEHPLRDCIYEEAEACKQLGKDTADQIDKQIMQYRKLNYPEHSGLIESNFFVVFLNERLINMFFRDWWREISLYSKRDQLSLGFALSKNNIKPAKLMLPGFSVRNNEDFSIYRHEQTYSYAIPDDFQRYNTICDPYDRDDDTIHESLDKKHLTTRRIDIIVCVYNALDDVKQCLSFVRRHLESGQRIIIVNDKSDFETSEYLRLFSSDDSRIILYENEVNLGYTQTANRGLSLSTADFRVLLNSDTIVSNGWIRKLAQVAYSRDSIGIVGPLSNAASYQSIPNIKGGKNQTAINSISSGISPDEIDLLCEKWSYKNPFPVVPLIHGFCFGIKKSLIDKLGYFDYKNFKRFYGEENDYCFRARAAGFELVVATNVYVYHKKSRSISEDERIVHMSQAGRRLRELYGAKNVAIACKQMASHPLLISMRKKSQKFFRDYKEDTKCLYRDSVKFN